MKIELPLIEGTFIRRYKRFLADISLPNGETVTVHCPNSGSMTGCAIPGARAWISDSNNPKRKLRYTLEIIEDEGVYICVNTHRPNALVEEAIAKSQVESLAGYTNIRREVRYGHENSRIDLLLTEGKRRCYVEVKNVTLPGENGLVRFPDAVTARGTKHLRELRQMVEQGERAVLFFCVSRDDATAFEPAAHIDPLYAKTLTEAVEAGVEVMAYRLAFDLPNLWIEKSIPVHIPVLAA
ncbi:MAG: DNA/RNA nuclease SfsA [Bradymonadia bacterium]